MESILETILTNAGFAGAVLAVCGWALWKKDQQVKALQDEAVLREREQAAAMGAYAGEFAAKLGAIADARTSDAQRVVGSLMELQEKDMNATMALNTTLTELKGAMIEMRADVRRRSSSSQSIVPGGG